MNNINLPLRSILPLSISMTKEAKNKSGIEILIVLSLIGVGSVILSNYYLLLVGFLLVMILYGIKIRALTIIDYSGNSITHSSGVHTNTALTLKWTDIQRVDKINDPWTYILGITSVKLYTSGSDVAAITIRYLLNEDAEIIEALSGHKNKEQIISDDDIVCDYRFIDTVKASLLTSFKHFYAAGVVTAGILLTFIVERLVSSYSESLPSVEETILTKGPKQSIADIASMFSHDKLLFMLVVVCLLAMLANVARMTYLMPRFWKLRVAISNEKIVITSGFMFDFVSTINIKDIVRVSVKQGLMAKRLGGTAIKFYTVSTHPTDNFFQLYIPFMDTATADRLLVALNIVNMDKPKDSQLTASIGSYLYYTLRRLILVVVPIILVVIILPLDVLTTKTISIYSVFFSGALIFFLGYQARCFHNAYLEEKGEMLYIGSYGWEPLVNVIKTSDIQYMKETQLSMPNRWFKSFIIKTDRQPLLIPVTNAQFTDKQ